LYVIIHKSAKDVEVPREGAFRENFLGGILHVGHKLIILSISATISFVLRVAGSLLKSQSVILLFVVDRYFPIPHSF
jgi:hypothetical protein